MIATFAEKDVTHPAPPQDAPARPRRQIRFADAILLLALGAVMASNADRAA